MHLCKCLNKIPQDETNDKITIRACISGCKLNKYGKLVHINIPGLDLEPQFYWNNCICNEYDALTRRHFLGYISGYNPRNPELKVLENVLLEMASVMHPFVAVSHQELMENTRSKLKKRYQQAYSGIIDRNIFVNNKEAIAKCFIKYEKNPISKFNEGKSPRLIQFRSFYYLYLLKKQMLGHSLQIKHEERIWFYGQSVKTIFTKIHDNYGIASVLKESWNEFCSPVAFCLDHSKFDGHYCKELLSLEHMYWKILNRSSTLKRLLDLQIDNRGFTAGGLKYKGNARLSGEYTTSEGNSVMNYAMIISWLRAGNISKARVHVNGDDSVVILDYSEINKLADLSYFRNFNMETEPEIITTIFQQISYCQASPIRLLKDNKIVWYMCKNPIRSLSRLQYCDKKFCDPKVYKRFLLSIGLCELAISSGVPIMQAFALLLIDNDARPLGCVDKIPARMSGNLSEKRAILNITRNDFEMAFGITFAQQKYYEECFAGRSRSSQDLKANLHKYKNFIYN